MTWLAVIALALVAFALAAFAFRLPRALRTSLLAALVFGLAGYALQASPSQPSAPTSHIEGEDLGDFDIVEARREFISLSDRSVAPTMNLADAMARRGRFVEASQLLGGITRENPADFEAWVAQGNALVAHAGGVLTPAGLYAYRRAAALRPQAIAPGYFLGVSLIQQARLMEARQVWREVLANAPEDAEGRAGLTDRLARLEQLLGQMGAPVEDAAPLDEDSTAPDTDTAPVTD